MHFPLTSPAGITGGFAPPRPSAMYDFTLVPTGESQSQTLLLASSVREDGTPSLQAAPRKAIALEGTGGALVAELEGILRRLPPAPPPANVDMYGRDVGIEWRGAGLSWRNSAPQGCARGPDDGVGVAGMEDREAFGRAVEIVDELVKRGVVVEGSG
ncbi:hypothetical protein EW146_g8958 [Bondarzewia mesenterica]|uniref:Uncharacterized protein n=1 Tax=Bondarzewia mesenterica TaxID=1095465 RepID=A0A4S4LAJ1_9AGAM|nr:hypothetical protein EW146_g8958 [Bondarzewia mesenterica]